MELNKGDTILFQGDSITDAGRARPANNPANVVNGLGHLGPGYAGKVAGMLLADNPQLQLVVHNRGVSGNRVTDLRDRWSSDCLELKPDLVSILIGINDTWHGVAKGTPENGVSVNEFDQVLRELIVTTKRALPDTRIVLCEPFTTEAGSVLRMNFHPDIDDRRAVVKAVASELADTFVPFQTLFDHLCKDASPDYWAPDGVHPSPAGHQKMAEFWIAHVTNS